MVYVCRIAIAGAGVSGFATVGYLVQALRHTPSTRLALYWFQPPRQIDLAKLPKAQRDRLIHLQSIGIDPSRLLGGGQVYHPAQPSLFTFNGNSAARGFDFVRQRYDTHDYFEWIQQNRSLLATLYPDFAPENGQQRHVEHTLDDIEGTTPRGAYGLYLHDKVMSLKANLPAHITLEVIPESVRSFSPFNQTVQVQTVTKVYEVDHYVDATGHRFAALRPEWAGKVFGAYPCDRYSQNLPPSVTVVGAGAAGIEVALHALHNLAVEKVTLVSRRGQARLPAVEPTEPYECKWFVREKMLANPTAAQAQVLLQQEIEACYKACDLPYPGWDALLQIDDYPAFLRDYWASTQHCPNHPLAHLVRPVMSFYGQVKDLLSAGDSLGRPCHRIQLSQLIDRVKPLFATQSRPCAELLLSAIQKKRLTLMAGEFLSDHETPTILRADNTLWQPECVILATGFEQSDCLEMPTNLAAQSMDSIDDNTQIEDTRCYKVAGVSLSSVHQQAAEVANAIKERMSFSLDSSLDSSAKRFLVRLLNDNVSKV